jgi:hypothetical protein
MKAIWSGKRMFKKNLHPLFVEDDQFDWGKKPSAGKKLLFSSFMAMGVAGFMLFVLPI